MQLTCNKLPLNINEFNAENNKNRPMAGISICSNGGGRNAAMFHLLQGPLANMKSPGLHQ